MTAARQRVMTNTMLYPGDLPIVGQKVSIRLNNPSSGWESNHVNQILKSARVVTDATGKWTATLDCNVDIEDGTSYYSVSQASGDIWYFTVPVGDFAVKAQVRDNLVTPPDVSNPPIVIAGLLITEQISAQTVTVSTSGALSFVENSDHTVSLVSA